MTTPGGWRAVLDGVVLSGDDEVEGVGCLSAPPDGLGMGELRTEDVTYPRRDGVRHFSDWYGPRIITLEDVSVCGDGCPGCLTTRAKVAQIIQAWRRRCDDVELVLYTDCHDPDAEDRTLTGPYGLVGRPRVADLTWLGQGSTCAVLTLRFDAEDQRLYVLDADGTPGSGEQCATLGPSAEVFCRAYPRCYDMCYDTDISPDTGGPVVLTVGGSLCVRPTVTLTGRLTNPTLTNQTTGEAVGYDGIIAAGTSIVIDMSTGTATEQPSGIPRTNLLTGNTRMQLLPGANVLNLTTTGPSDTGSAEVCWRPQVDFA